MKTAKEMKPAKKDTLLYFFIVLVLTFGLSTCVSESLTEPESITGWEYISSIGAEKEIPWVDSQPVPHGNRLQHPQGGSYYKAIGYFTLEELPEEDIYLLVDRTESAMRFSLNGLTIGVFGQFPPDLLINSAVTYNPILPQEHLKLGKNEVKIIGYSDSGTSAFPKISMGRLKEKQYRERVIDFINADFFVYLAAISFLISFNYFFQFFNYKEDKKSLYFALFNLFLGIYFQRFSVVHSPFGYLFGLKAGKACISIATLYLYFFFMEYLPGFKNKMINHALHVFFWIIFLSILVIPQNYEETQKLLGLSLIPTQLLMFIIIYLIIKAHTKGVPDLKPILAGTIIGIAASSHDIFQFVAGDYGPVWYQGIGIFVFDFSVFYSLALGNEKMRKALKVYSKGIEEEVKKRTQQLNAANKKLKIADRAKRQFLANMSHEMRTPLNGIIGFAEHMLYNRDAAKKPRFLEQIIKESEKLRNMINQLLDISKIESGKMELVPVPFRWGEIEDFIQHTLGEQIRQKGLEFKYSSLVSREDCYLGDSLRIQQILTNLVGNSIKFTQSGHISIEVTDTYKNGKIQLWFTIGDTGIGIPAHRQKDVFDSFVQADSSMTRRFGGSGLGMGLAKQFIQMMSGDIKLNSTENRGTEIRFHIELDEMEPDELQTERNDENINFQAQGFKVLIVEDYVPNQQVAKLHLEHMGIECAIANNGLEALEFLKTTTVNLILMDIHMPEMDGITATKEIRKNPEWADIPIIGLTADAYPKEIEQYMVRGMSDVLTKPLRRQTLLQTIARYLPHQGPLRQKTAIPIQNNTPVDIEALTSELHDDRNLAIEMLENFIENAKNSQKKIVKSLETSNLKTVHREAHSIKGGALNLMALDLVNAASKLELIAKQGTIVSGVDYVRDIEQEIKSLEEYLNTYLRNQDNTGKDL